MKRPAFLYSAVLAGVALLSALSRTSSDPVEPVKIGGIEAWEDLPIEVNEVPQEPIAKSPEECLPTESEVGRKEVDGYYAVGDITLGKIELRQSPPAEITSKESAWSEVTPTPAKRSPTTKAIKRKPKVPGPFPKIFQG